MTDAGPDGVPLAPPIACSLTTLEVQTRVAEWSALMRDALSVVPTESGSRVTFVADPGTAARVADLALREQQCCPFFGFTVSIAGGGLALDVMAPEEARPLVAQLVGAGRP